MVFRGTAPRPGRPGRSKKEVACRRTRRASVGPVPIPNEVSGGPHLMRRALFGGIGLALGFFANPVAGQDARGVPQPVRAAKLGAPVAVPDVASVPDGEVTPAGLRTR